MKNLVYFFLFIGMVTTAQVERIQVKGQIITELNTSLTGITVFNRKENRP